MAKAKKTAAKASNRVVQLSSDSKTRKRVLVEFTAAELDALWWSDMIALGGGSPEIRRVRETLRRAHELVRA